MRSSIEHIYQELSAKHNIPVEAIKQLEKDWWNSIKKELGSKSGRDILIPDFGSIYLDRYTLNAQLFLLNRNLQNLEENFKAGKIRWMDYLYKWRDLNYVLASAKLIKENLLKRDVRKKWQRGI